MKNFADEILAKIDAEIESIGFNNDITMNDALHMIEYIIPLYDQLRKFIVDYNFLSIEDEIYFFKELKPNILGRYLYFNKVYKIESQCPNGSNEVIKEYLNNELGGLTYFFRRNLDFTNITVLNQPYMMLTTLFVEKQIFVCVAIVSNVIEILCFQQDTIIKLPKYWLMKCFKSI